jgi:hypothetical protein
MSGAVFQQSAVNLAYLKQQHQQLALKFVLKKYNFSRDKRST